MLIYIKLGETASVSETNLSPYDWLTLSIRKRNFKLQVEVLHKLLSCYFIIYEHYNYARWLTMHCFEIFITNTKFLDVYQLPFEKKLFIPKVSSGVQE